MRIERRFRDGVNPAVCTPSVANQPPIRFFSAYEEKLLQAIIDRLLPRDDCWPTKRLAILPMIDHRLDKHALNGFRYQDMLPDRDAYCDGLRAIDEMARERHGSPFAELSVRSQELILKSLHDGVPDPPHEVWKRMPVHRFWNMLIEDCADAYHALPWARNERGFGGRTCPPGSMHLDCRLAGSQDVNEVRYGWSAPFKRPKIAS